MKQLFLLCACVFVSCSVLAAGEFEPSAIHEIVSAELVAMKLPANSPFCLELLPARNLSETGADPSRKLLRYLARRGMRPRKVSACYKPSPKGNVISIEVITAEADRLSAKVVFGDLRPGEDLGILHRRGVYQLTKGEKGQWVIQSYADKLNE
jgi:hypothetical protein